MYDRDNPILDIIKVLTILFVIIRGIFASESHAVRTLKAQGYSNIEIVHNAWLLVGVRGCDVQDAARFIAKVTNPAGGKAEVYVCTGFPFKGGTIRVP